MLEYTNMDKGEIKSIISNLDEVIANKKNYPLDIVGSRIVGITLVRDDIERFFESHPMLEEVAELGAELETLKSSPYEKEVFSLIQHKMELLKASVEKKY